MQAVLARLIASPPLLVNGNVRRSHRTPVTRAAAPALHLVDGADEPKPANNDCRTDRTKYFTVSLFGRDDGGVAVLDTTVVAINRRLDPLRGTPYPNGAVLRQRRITPNEETADGDALRIDMDFEFEYSTDGWTLE